MSALTMTVPAVWALCTAKQQTVDGTAAALSPLAIGDEVKKPNAIFLQALPGNSGTITVGRDNSVTSLGAGIVLSAGANITLPMKDPSEWYVIASGAGQKLNILYLEKAE